VSRLRKRLVSMTFKREIVNPPYITTQGFIDKLSAFDNRLIVEPKAEVISMEMPIIDMSTNRVDYIRRIDSVLSRMVDFQWLSRDEIVLCTLDEVVVLTLSQVLPAYTVTRRTSLRLRSLSVCTDGVVYGVNDDMGVIQSSDKTVTWKILIFLKRQSDWNIFRVIAVRTEYNTISLWTIEQFASDQFNCRLAIYAQNQHNSSSGYATA
jgi:hypothetical protein